MTARAAVAYLRLSRGDAPLIAFFSYIVGLHLTGAHVGWKALGTAALVAGISTNFIYALNSLCDEADDRIAHPRRPLPASEISRSGAARYVAVLLLLATVYPLAVASSMTSLALFWLLPALGIVYSVSPPRLRRFPTVAVVVISCGLVTPLALGVFEGGEDPAAVAVIAALFVFCLAVVPLKAVEEVEQDAATGSSNLFTRFGRGLFSWSVAVLVVDGWFVALTTQGHVRAFLLATICGALACLWLFWRRHDVAALYRAIIGVTLAVGATYLAILQLLDAS